MGSFWCRTHGVRTQIIGATTAAALPPSVAITAARTAVLLQRGNSAAMNLVSESRRGITWPEARRAGEGQTDQGSTRAWRGAPGSVLTGIPVRAVNLNSPSR